MPPQPGLYVGVDVGGTKILAGLVGERGELSDIQRGSTPGRRVTAEALEDALTEVVTRVAGSRPLAAVGLAAAGFVDATGDRVRFAPHLPWRDHSVRQTLSDRWGVPVVLDNDANCAAAAESAYGAAAGAASAVLITMGTGIGGAVVVDGHVLRGTNGMAGEFGHAQVMPDGVPCECGHQGCWEQYASGNALVRYARERLGREPSILEEICHGRPELLTGPMVTAAAEEGDLLARQAFGSVGDWLGVGVANLVAALDPEVVVIGGGVSAAGDKLLEPARSALTRALVGVGHRVVPPIRAAAFGPQSGLVGAGLMARSAHG
jgi:glucokinase